MPTLRLGRLAVDIEAAIAQRQKLKDALSDPECYRQFIAEGHHADFQFPPAVHHRLIQDALKNLVLEDDYDAILIMAPPGSAKSTYASVQFATWYFARFPMNKILACSNTTNLAEDFARRRRSVCEMQQWEILAGTQLDKNQLQIGGFGTLRGGIMYARGVGSSIAGLRCNLLLTDDAIASFEEASSANQLDKIWEWYMTDARTRLVPDGKEAVIMTRWSRKDIAGRILERIESGDESKRWKILRLPMLCDDPKHDPMGRNLNEPLWPEWFSDGQISDNINHPIRWPSLYQQVPVDAGGTWVDEAYLQFKLPSEKPEQLNYIVAVDLALSQGQGDYTVITVAGVDEDRNVWIVDCMRDQTTTSKTLKRLCAVVNQYHPDYVLIDDDPAAKVFTESMREYARNTGEAVIMKPLPIRANDKEYRAAPIRDLFMQSRVFILQAQWTPLMVREIMNFPPKSKLENDDIIDTLSLIGRDLGTQSNPQNVEPLKQPPIEGAFTEKNGQMHTTATFNELWNDKPLRVGGRRRI